MKFFLTLDAVKTQIKRKNFWVLTFITALSVATILVLWDVNNNVRALEQAELLYNTQLLKQLEQSNDLASIEIEFKTQVQEWKDVLLRGHDPDLYKKYWQQFENSEAKVHQRLEDLHRDLLALELQDHKESVTQLNNAALITENQVELKNLQQQSASQLRFSDKVLLLTESHVLIGKIYREYLGRYSLSESADFAFEIDKGVRGIDRWLSEQLAELRKTSVSNQESLTAKANALQLNEIHELRMHIQRSIAVVIVILLANMWLLLDRLRSSAKEVAEITEKSDATIYELAYSDGLTGLPNRRLFSDKLDHAIVLSSNTGNYGGLVFLDLDNFKTLNDTKGHAKGDLLLVEVSKRLKNSVRSSDTVARLGGDEFVVILDALSNDPVTAAEQAHTIAEKISISLAHPYRLENYTHHGSASIGVALFSRGEINSEELIKRADTAMYEAKRAGRNTVRFYDQTVQKSLEARSSLEHSLHSAIAEKQFELYYQIQVDQHKKPIGAEGLLRWHHPELGLLYPQDFIGLAEESDLILPIGAWVLSTACTQLKKWEASEATRDLVLSINISAVQLRKSNHTTEQLNFGSTRRLRKPSLVEQVQNAIATSQIHPSRLKLEITESLALHDIDFTIETLLHLKALGISIAMDDFGTGHSSLAHLKRMPLDQIKIDQSFVDEIVSDNYDQAIVKSMVDMANNIGIRIIAEGVENQAQLDVLLNQGCDLFQGFLFGEALPIDEFEQGLMKYVKSEK